MKKINKFVLEGRNFSDLNGFYKEFERVFLKSWPRKFEMGRNLNALNDVLYPNEKEKGYKRVIVWNDFDKSERELPTEQLIHILEVIQNHKKDIELILKRKKKSKFEKSRKTLGMIFGIIILLACALQLASAIPTLPYVLDTAVPQQKNLQMADNTQIDLFSGAAVYSYPLELPPGTHGLQPKIVLSYTSQSLGQRPDNIGSGWGLSESYIQRDTNNTFADTSDDVFRLTLEGNSYELVYSQEDGRYHTKIESFLSISNYTLGENQKSQYWIAKSREGKAYRFGFYNFSETVANKYDYVWRWNLDVVNDTYGNSIFYNYTENPYAEDEGTVYLQGISYNNDKQRKVFFVYESNSRPDAWRVYEEGNKITQSRRLHSIDTYANGNLVNSYVLNYTLLSTSASISLLSSVTRYGSDNATSLPPVKFGYLSAAEGWTNMSVWNIPGDLCFSDDAGGGRDQGIREIDVNGDGKIDLLKAVKLGGPCASANRTAYINNGTGWMQKDSWEPPICFTDQEGYDLGSRFVDVNNDGMIDVLYGLDATGSCTDGERAAYINNGTGWVQNELWEPPQCFNNNQNIEKGIRFADVNGDGLVDMLRGAVQSGTCSSASKTAFINNGTNWVQDDRWEPPVCFSDDAGGGRDQGTRIVDVNGDKLPDIIVGWDSVGCVVSERTAYINNGTGWVQDDLWQPPICFNNNIGHDRGARLADINGDGLIDILYGLDVSGSCGTGERAAYLNNGTNWVQNDMYEPEVCFINNQNIERGVRLTDVNGDAVADTIRAEYSAPVCTKQAYVSNTTKSFLLSNITNSLGATVKIDYQKSTYLNNANATGNRSNLDFNVWLVANITEDNGLVGVQNVVTIKNYNYSGGEYNYKDKEFRGFAFVEERIDNKLVRHWFHQDTGRKGREYATEVLDVNGNPYARVENNWSFTLNASVYITFLTTTSEIDYDGSLGGAKVKNTSYRYDAFGNTVLINNSGDVSRVGDERYEQFNYLNNSDAWIVSVVKNYTLRSGSGSKIRETIYSYDWLAYGQTPIKGSVTSKQEWLSTSAGPTTNYSYDSLGNIVNTTDPNGRVTTFIYGVNDATRTFVERVVNAKSQQTNYIYDLGTGNKLSESDVNGVASNYTYDVFGRKTKEILKYDSVTYPTTTYEYIFDGNAPESVIVKKREQNGTSATFDEYQFYDGFGRYVQTKKEADSGQQIVVDLYYDNASRVVRQTLPYLATFDANYSSPNQTIGGVIHAYDVRDREIRMTNPDTSFRNMSYQRWNITTYDEENNRRDQTLDAYGKISAVVRYNGSTGYATRYTYDSASMVTAITDAANNNITYSYDTLGRKIAMIDPDVGSWTYEYDSSGNLVNQTDGRKITTKIGYDSLNRKTSEISPDQSVMYGYDAQLNGTLSSVTTDDSATTYGYDLRLRQTSATKNMSGLSFTTLTSYDALGRKTSERLPSGETLSYSYGAQGLVSSLDGVANVNYAAHNMPTGITYGNAQVSNYTYSSSTLRMQRVMTDTKQDLTYGYDNIGSPTFINDSAHAIVTIMGYDDFDQLTYTSIIGNGYTNVVSFAYNSIGNMLQMSGTRNTTFSYEGNPVHGPSRIVSE